MNSPFFHFPVSLPPSFSPKWKWGILFIALLFIAIGIYSTGRLALTYLLTPPISIPHPTATSDEQIPSVNYLFQTLLVDTPFATDLPIKEPLFPDLVCSIEDFGAVPDGKTLNTEAFRKAITSCADAGGGKVLVPPGTWLTGPIQLKNNINLEIERDATIRFSTKLTDYLPAVFSRFEGIEYYNYAPPISANDSTNVAITGAGTIDGQGSVSWWKLNKNAARSITALYAMGDDNVPVENRVFGTPAAGLRPAFIEFINCHNILVENIKILDGPMWTIHPVYSDNIVIRGVDIQTSPGPSTDGIAIDSSSFVLIENSSFDTGDDAIVLKSGRDREGMRLHRPTENIVIRNNTIKETHAAVAIGSEMSGDVRNVFATDIDIRSAQFAFRIKANVGRGGIVENIWAQNFTAHSLSIEAIQITTAYGTPFRADSVVLPTFKNINVKNFAIRKTSRAISINGLAQLPVSAVSLSDITIGSRYGIDISQASDIELKNLTINLSKDEPLLTVKDSQRVTVSALPCLVRTPECLVLEGTTTSAIDITGSPFESSRITTLPDTQPDALIR